VTTAGDKQIIVTVPNVQQDELVRQVGQTAVLRFRPVYTADQVAPEPTSDPTSAPTEDPTAEPSGPASETAQAQPSEPAASAPAQPSAAATPTRRRCSNRSRCVRNRVPGSRSTTG